ncbi:LysR family transcriptional regulator [Archangium lipolyticum]|uniref:LysR family transcriptional regulator n=1 Tax=Archangium lipolyticum TaxID=2970465 RepID=UPI00214A788D|nr:LysR family transcriptional regulator [Archangium lipolyticum]
MASTSPDWSLYRSFVAVLREGSLSAAARALGLSQPTLGRHIALLESALGVALFTRSPDGLTPTLAAEALRPEAESLAAAADALFRTASGSLKENAGTVRLTVSEVFAAEVVAPTLARLQADHPRIVVEVAVSNRSDDLLRREADIAVRLVRPSQGALVARRVGAVELGLFAHPSYLARRPAPRSVAELEGHALVGFDRGAPYTRTLQLEGRPLTREQFTFRSDNDLAQLAAIRAGCGIGACHVPLAHRSELVRILPAAFAPTVEMWVAMHEDLRTTARYRTVFAALTAGLKDYLREPASRSRRQLRTR